MVYSAPPRKRGFLISERGGKPMSEEAEQLRRKISKVGSITKAFQEVGIQASADLIIEMIRQKHQQEVDANMVESVRSYLKH